MLGHDDLRRDRARARWSEGARAIWQLDAVEVLDGSGNTFARQGIFVP